MGNTGSRYGWNSTENRKKFVSTHLNSRILANESELNKLKYINNYNKTRSNYTGTSNKHKNKISITRKSNIHINVEKEYIDIMKTLYIAYNYFDLYADYTYHERLEKLLYSFEYFRNPYGIEARLHSLGERYASNMIPVFAMIDKLYNYELLRSKNTPERILNVKLCIKYVMRELSLYVVAGDYEGNKCKDPKIKLSAPLLNLITNNKIQYPIYSQYDSPRTQELINAFNNYIQFPPEVIACFDVIKPIWNRRKHAIILGSPNF